MTARSWTGRQLLSRRSSWVRETHADVTWRSITMSWEPVFLFAVAAAAAVVSSCAACTTDTDCSLNGFCRGGSCDCDPGWQGGDCGLLKLAPTGYNPHGSGRVYPAASSNTSSWGGGVVHRDGMYHLYTSEMAGRCGLASWATNSFIRHAVSPTVDGVYAPRETVLPAWSHNAMPWVTPDGYVSIWHIGNGSLPRPERTGCQNGTTPAGPGPHAAGEVPRVGKPAPISQIPYASSPGGPWRAMSLTCTTPTGPGPCPIDNPTPVAMRNGTTLLAHRARGGFGILVAPHWSGPYRNVAAGLSLNSTNVPAPKDEYSCEDGFLFLDRRGGIHLICHCNGMFGYPWDDHGRHAFSLDGVTWRWSRGRTFTPTFTHPDGTNTSHVSRQRPQLVFGPDQTPSHLITGLAVASTNRPLPWQAGCGELDAVSKPCDLTCTSIQAIVH